MRVIAALFVACLAACHITPVRAGADLDLAGRLHALVMEAVKSYGQLNEPKVMAACIEWRTPDTGEIRLHNVFIAYTGEASDVPIFVTSLAQKGLHNCRKWASSENVHCTCQMLDQNGKNVLEVPE